MWFPALMILAAPILALATWNPSCLLLAAFGVLWAMYEGYDGTRNE